MLDRFGVDEVEINVYEASQIEIKNVSLDCTWNVVKCFFATNMAFVDKYSITFGNFSVSRSKFDLDLYLS